MRVQGPLPHSSNTWESMWISNQLPWNAPSASNQLLIVFEPAQEAQNHSLPPIQRRNQVHGRNSPLQVLLSRVLLTPRGLCVPLSAAERVTTGRISKQKGRMNGRRWGQRPVSPNSSLWGTHWRVVTISFMQPNTHPAVRLCPLQAFPAGGSMARQSRVWAGLREGSVRPMCQHQWAAEPVRRGRERGERVESLVRETK